MALQLRKELAPVADSNPLDREKIFKESGNLIRIPNSIEKTIDQSRPVKVTQLQEPEKKVALQEFKKTDKPAGSNVFIHFPAGIENSQHWKEFREDVRNFVDGQTNGATYVDTSTSAYFGIQGAQSFEAIYNSLQMALNSAKARLPNSQSGNDFAVMLNDVQVSGSMPASRKVLFRFNRTESAKELIDQSTVKDENSKLYLYGGIALALLIAFK